MSDDTQAGMQAPRISLGVSIGDTVPMWGHRYLTGRPWYRRQFYAIANRSSEHTYGTVGIKLGLLFIRLTYGRRP